MTPRQDDSAHSLRPGFQFYSVHEITRIHGKSLDISFVKLISLHFASGAVPTAPSGQALPDLFAAVWRIWAKIISHLSLI